MIETKAKQYATLKMNCLKCSDDNALCENCKCQDWKRCYEGFKDGVNWILDLKWININDELPYEHEDLLMDNDKNITKKVLVLYNDTLDLTTDYMFYNFKFNKWKWFKKDFIDIKFWVEIKYEK